MQRRRQEEQYTCPHEVAASQDLSSQRVQTSSLAASLCIEDEAKEGKEEDDVRREQPSPSTSAKAQTLRIASSKGLSLVSARRSSPSFPPTSIRRRELRGRRGEGVPLTHDRVREETS